MALKDRANEYLTLESAFLWNGQFSNSTQEALKIAGIFSMTDLTEDFRHEIHPERYQCNTSGFSGKKLDSDVVKEIRVWMNIDRSESFPLKRLRDKDQRFLDENLYKNPKQPT